MLPRLSRRRFIYLSVAGALGAGGYRFFRSVRSVREAAGRMSSV